jgi:cold shock CspA family protein
MQIEPQISFRNVRRNASLDRMILGGIEKLEEVHGRITAIRMAVEDQRGPGTHDHLYRVRLEVSVPGREVIVKETPAGDPHPSLDQVLNEAFDTARRRLKEMSKRQKGEVKDHALRAVGRVVEIFPGEEYGFIEDSDGRRIYFHRNSVAGDGWEGLDTGDGVEFDEEQGDKGPQAVTVYPLR